MATLYLTPNTAEQTTYHYSFQGSAGEGGTEVPVLVPLDVDAGALALVPEYIRKDPNFSVDVHLVSLSSAVVSATPATLIQNPAGVNTGFEFMLNNTDDAEAEFRLNVEIRHSMTR